MESLLPKELRNARKLMHLTESVFKDKNAVLKLLSSVELEQQKQNIDNSQFNSTFQLTAKRIEDGARNKQQMF